jgi:Family of unknown function (DUF5681)
MSEENMSDSYEIGYGKPPKATQFKKGSSGNPKGRPKKALDFDLELLRQSKATVVININGRSRRISKHEAVSMQLINKAASGYMPALRTYVDRYEKALAKAAQLDAAQSSGPPKYNFGEMTDAELWALIPKIQKEEEEEMNKGHISDAD